MTDPAQPPSVIDALASQPSFEWSTPQATAYEAAVEAINGAVGAYTMLIQRENQRPTPDQAAIDGWRQGRRDCEAARRSLDPADPEQITHTRQHYAQLIETLRQSGQAS